MDMITILITAQSEKLYSPKKNLNKPSTFMHKTPKRCWVSIYTNYEGGDTNLKNGDCVDGGDSEDFNGEGAHPTPRRSWRRRWFSFPTHGGREMICPLMRKRRNFLRIESYIKRRKWDRYLGNRGNQCMT
jgi:hypothetical protein